MNRILIRVGGLCYFAWGVMHVWVSWTIWQLGTSQASGWIHGRLQQDAVFMLFFSLASIVATAYLWREKIAGYWMSLLLVSYADIFWIVLFIMPGLVGGLRGWAGPILWLSAAALTTAGFLMRGRSTSFESEL